MDQRNGSATPEAPVAERPKRRAIWIVVALIVVVAAAVGVYLARSNDGAESPAADTRTTVAEFSGDDDQVTETFDVEPGWQIHWETTGKRFQFAIDGEEFDYGTVIKEKGSASGVTSPVGEGTFRLNVKAQGPWSVKILQGEPPSENNE